MRECKDSTINLGTQLLTNKALWLIKVGTTLTYRSTVNTANVTEGKGRETSINH